RRLRRLHDGADRRRHLGGRRRRGAGELSRPAEPLSRRRDHDPRPARGPGPPGRRGGGTGAGTLRGPTDAGGTRGDPRPASLSGTGAAVRNTMRGAWYVVAAVAIAAGACKKGKAGGAGDPSGGGPMGMPVEVAAARTDTVRDEIAATGQIEAVQSIDLRPEVDGRIVEILIREGQEVDEGTPLFKVDA